MNNVIVLVVSKKPLENNVYEYWLRFPNRSIEVLTVKSGAIDVGNKLELTEEIVNEKKHYKINRIV